MRDKTLIWILFCFLTLLNLAAAQAFGETTDNVLLSLVERSRDSHAIDEFPSIEKSKSQSSSKVEEKTAHEQITESIRTDSEQPLKPKTSGKVMVTTEEKTEAAKNSTEIVNDKTQTRELSAEAKYERPTIALALGGGGVRGASHVGVLRVLKQANIPIDYIVGNSMGSIVGGLYAAGVPLEEIEKTMFDDSLRKAYLPNSIPARILGKPLEKAMHPFKKNYAGIWTGKKLSDFFEKHLPPGVVNVEDTPIPFSAVATNLIDGKAYRISDGKLSMAMRASSTIPPLLKPVAVGDKVFVDGGMRANLPASAARDTGADIVIAVLVDEPLKDVPAERFTKVGAIVQRVGDVMLAISDAHQLPFADIVINPDVSGLPILRGKVEDARRAIAAGEAAAKKALPDILREISERENKSRLSAGQIPENLK